MIKFEVVRIKYPKYEKAKFFYKYNPNVVKVKKTGTTWNDFSKTQ